MSRKGFCKLALQTGTSIVPTYVFGSSDVFQMVRLPDILTRFSRRIRVSFALFHGRWFLPVPYPVRIAFAHGEPIHVAKIDSPSPNDVDDLHAKYVAELKRTFDTHKATSNIIMIVQAT